MSTATMSTVYVNDVLLQHYRQADRSCWINSVGSHSKGRLLLFAARSTLPLGVIDPDKLSPNQPHNHQNVKLDEADGRNYEQIHRGDVRRMVAQEGAPALTDGPPFWATYLATVDWSHRKAELEQFALNARRAPKHILNAHPPDQCPQIRTELAADLLDCETSSDSSDDRHDATARVSRAE
jgi:hypothetical protein